MIDNFQDEEEIELSLDDLHELADMNKAKDDLANSMRAALIYGWYATAFLYAEKLRKFNYGHFYSEYSDEINECRIICAANGEEKSMISIMNSYTVDQYEGKGIDPRAYCWLQKLYRKRYIPCIRWLAECIEEGIGCESSAEAAYHYYFESLIVEGKEFCRLKVIELICEKYHLGREYKLIKQLIYHPNLELIRGVLGVYIMEKKIGFPARKEAYPALRASYNVGCDGVALSYLGECLLYGIGTSINIPAASHVLYEAKCQLELMIEILDDCNGKDDYESIERTYLYEADEFYKSYNKTKEMIEETDKIFSKCISSKKVYCLGPDFSDYINSFIDQDDDYIDVDLIADQLVHLWETASVLYF